MKKYTNEEFIKFEKKENKYNISNLDVGDVIEMLEVYYTEPVYNEYVILQVIPKGKYNMYLCLNKYGIKQTFTDMDIYLFKRSKNYEMIKI